MRRKRLYYVPGLISLIGLPLLLLFGPEEPVRPVTMGVRLPAEKNDSLHGFTRSRVMEMLKGKKIELLAVDDRPSRLHPELNVYRKSHFLLDEMARLQFVRDTNRVLRVHFFPENDYGDLVWAVDQARIFMIHRYVYIDNDLYIFANPPRSLEEPEGLLVDWGGPYPEWTPPTKWEILWTRISYKWREFVWEVKRTKVFCTAFVLLIVLPVLFRMIRARGMAGS